MRAGRVLRVAGAAAKAASPYPAKPDNGPRPPPGYLPHGHRKPGCVRAGPTIEFARPHCATEQGQWLQFYLKCSSRIILILGCETRFAHGLYPPAVVVLGVGLYTT